MNDDICLWTDDNGEIQWVMVTSSSTVDDYMWIYPPDYKPKEEEPKKEKLLEDMKELFEI